MEKITGKEVEHQLPGLDSQVCFSVYALSRQITQHYRPILDELDITYPQYLTLLVLWEKEKQSVNQLGEKLYLDSGTLTPMLKRLEQKGLIKRERSVSDERVVEISLSEKGSQLRYLACAIPQKLLASLNITQEELAQLHLIVNKILDQARQS